MKTILLFLLVTLTIPAWSKNNRKPADNMANPEIAVEVPIDREVCFAPDEPCAAKLAKAISSANESLDIAIFDINLDQIVHQISVAAVVRKIPVRVLVDRRQASSPNSLVSTLVAAKVPVRFGVQRGIMHNKFAIIDKKMLVTGSFNFTNGAAFKNNENQIYLSDPNIIARYQKRFDEIWGESAEYKPSKKKK